jgi:hypothetical protein
MKKAFSLVMGLLTLCLALPAAAVAPADPQLTSDRQRYRSQAPVTITLMNQADYPLTFENPWRIENSEGETVARFSWADEANPVGQGDTRTWTWDQSPNDCNSDGACTKVGGYVPPGRYTAIVETQDGPARAKFLIGEYFTVGFKSRPHIEFVVFAAEPQAVEQMRSEAAAADKTMNVSGIVRPGRTRYNPDWKFTMAPTSIILAEVWIEVCDGSPYYVQKHRDEWRGDRWCPWSSYVKRVGR